jgi:UDP-N-acetylmuramoyl-L-alanyl-D-glutamate--2,6-diaminopimelate ligase
MKTVSNYAEYLDKLITDKLITESDDKVDFITCDSRKVKLGTLFFAIEGSANDGHCYIESAVKNGAVGIVHGKALESYVPGVSYLKVENQYLAYALACEYFFDCPTNNLRLHGITGTNGKTTTAFLIEHILSRYNSKCGLITTVECRNGSSVFPAEHTTPEAFELQKLFRQIADNNCKDAVMEVSSHGLDQFRPGSTEFHSAVFTNLTGDHLDYHKNMEKYFQAKKRLFSHYLAAAGTAIVNVDDSYGKRLADEFKHENIITYGKGENADCRMIDLITTASGTSFALKFKGSIFQIHSYLIGEYNAYNSCAAFCMALSSGIDGEAAAACLSEKIQIPGRLERFEDKRGVSYFVDYAHTDDALRNVLKNLKKIVPGKIITVFGCGGDRDRSKRPRMGKAASEYSDLLVITSDNPRSEKPVDIIDEIITGLDYKTAYKIEPDREKAIKLASGIAEKGDFVLVAGKGHECTQDINGQVIEFDDKQKILSICAT